MANRDNPHGLRPLGINIGGGSPEIEAFVKLASYATAIFRNDAVNRAADHGIQTGGTPGTTLYSGVALAYAPASTLVEQFLVMTDPKAVFEAQADGALAEADMGLNANLLLTAGNTTTKMSNHEIDSTTEATTATLDVKLLRRHAVQPATQNEYGAYVRVEIVFNKHRMAPGVAGV